MLIVMEKEYHHTHDSYSSALLLKFQLSILAALNIFVDGNVETWINLVKPVSHSSDLSVDTISVRLTTIANHPKV